MPILRAAARQLRKDRKRHERNQAFRSELRTVTKQLKLLLRDRKLEEAGTLIRQVVRLYDRAAHKHLIHHNTASRVKSRLARRLTQASAH